MISFFFSQGEEASSFFSLSTRFPSNPFSELVRLWNYSGTSRAPSRSLSRLQLQSKGFFPSSSTSAAGVSSTSDRGRATSEREIDGSLFSPSPLQLSLIQYFLTLCRIRLQCRMRSWARKGKSRKAEKGRRSASKISNAPKIKACSFSSAGVHPLSIQRARSLALSLSL